MKPQGPKQRGKVRESLGRLGLGKFEEAGLRHSWGLTKELSGFVGK